MASRFPPRDRSPHRYSDRRPPPPHAPSGPRAADDVNSTPLGRDPPRGPKALIDRSGGPPFPPPGPKSRGFSGRGDFRDRDRDRDIRDSRDSLSFRRDVDRDWPRRDRGFDSRDSRVPFGRGRSRSPPPLRDFRDTRDASTRDLDAPRPRRNSRDGLTSSSAELPPFRGPHMRGRGRGDREWGRGRSNFLDDRDSFRRRSRSREGWRERDARMDRDRDRNRDLDRRDRFDRREDDRRSDRDERERPQERLDTWKRDREPPKIESRLLPPSGPPSVSTASPTTSVHTSGENAPSYDTSEPIRRPTIPIQPVRDSIREPIRDQERNDQNISRQEHTVPRPVAQSSPPPSVPEVPAFGSVTTPEATATNYPVTSPQKFPLTKSQEPAPSVPAGSAASTTSGPSSEHQDKERKEPLGETPTIQPPTGPKANRVEGRHLQEPQPPRVPLDSRTRNEVPVRLGRPASSYSVTSSTSAPDHTGLGYSSTNKPKDSIKVEQKALEAPPYPRGPGRPHSSSASPPTSYRTIVRRGSVSGPGGSPPVAQAGPLRSPGPKTSPNMPFASIPTGPRALQRSAAPRSGSKPSNQWVRPGYPVRGPNVAANTASTKREIYEDRERSPSHTNDPSELVEHGGSPTSDKLKLPSTQTEEEKPKTQETEKGPANEVVPESEQQQSSDIKTPRQNEKSATTFMFDQSSGAESDEEDDLDEEDFNEGEKRFEKEMQVLAADMPPPPLEDPVIVGLLMKIQILGIIAEGSVPAYLDEPGAAIEIEKPDQPSAVIPLSAKDTEELQLPEQSSSEAVVSQPGPTTVDRPALDNLPFFNSGPPTPFSEMDTYQETLRTHDRIKDALRAELSRQHEESTKEHKRIREEYINHYRPWRQTITEMDRKKREETTTTPGPPTPPSAVSVPTHSEGRRGYKLNSELDFQNALKASEISALEEQERREKQETSKPDMTKEALIPPMLEPREQKATVFKDTNQAVDPTRAFEVFKFYPVENDFTPEEHKIFTDAFMAHPKKWGKIAESLPGRTFQQCINHYYLTKEEIKYKAKLNKKWTRRRGRKAAVRPRKSNALMADLGVRPEYDGEEATSTTTAAVETPAVTDTGRPRRAAAPTFGDNETENNTPTPASGRRGNHAKEAGEQTPAEKPPSRRGGRGGSGTRGGRRTRGQGQQQSVASTPIAAAPPKVELEATPVEPTTTEPPPLPAKEKEEPEKVVAVESNLPRIKPGRSRTREPLPVVESVEGGGGGVETGTPKQVEGGYGSQQPTSYWSVLEQRDFSDLIGHFGKDFEGVAHFMKTKTPTMVCAVFTSLNIFCFC